jgi:hypothetical protein
MHFVCCWYDAVAQSINVQVDMGTVFTQPTGGAITTSTFPFQIGGWGNTRGWQGNVDAAGFAKGFVLSPQERLQLYNADLGRQWPF